MSADGGKGRWQELAKNPRIWLGLAIAVLAIAFILQNRDSVQVDLLTFQFSAPQWVTLLVVFLAGDGHWTSGQTLFVNGGYTTR